MPSKLQKVQKHVTKKKGSKINALHENSRDALRLRKAGARDDKVARMGVVREKANKNWLDRVAFCQENLPETLHPFDVPQIQELVGLFIQRNDEEIVQLNAERRPGRPPSTRLTLLEQQRDNEKKEYESGFWLPDLRDVATLEKVDDWKGQWLGLGIMRFVRVQADGVAKDSQFPPRGSS